MMPQPAVPEGPRDILWQAAHLLPRLVGSTVTEGDVIQALLMTAAAHYPAESAAKEVTEKALARLGSYLLVHCESSAPSLLAWLDGCLTRTATWAMKAASEQPTLQAS